VRRDGPGYRLVPIRRVDVYRQVITEIETLIERNGLVPGDRLPSDRDLAEMLHVSRASVRQALKVLEGLGRIGAQHGSGTYVREPGFAGAIADLTRGVPFDRSVADQLVPVHRAIELAVLEAAFATRSEEHIAHVRAALERRAEELANDPEEGSLEFSFETSLGEVCGNPFLRRLQALVQELFVRAWGASGEVPGDKQKLFEEHVGVFERFAEGDLLGALARFREHLSFPPQRLFQDAPADKADGVQNHRATRAHVPAKPAPTRQVGERSTQRGNTA
jgi:GntR family transcriptional regulator, transcriptional repressor for pyruvate dehydrogenase complex